MTKIALGTWAWGAGAFGGDKVFGSKADVENLKPVFDTAMKEGAESLGHRYGLRHGRFREDSWFASTGLIMKKHS